MTEPSSVPGDPSELRLRISYDDALADTPQTDTLERWDVTILHRRRTHDDATDPAASNACAGEDCALCTVEDAAVGTMTFYRVHLDRGTRAHGGGADVARRQEAPSSTSCPRSTPRCSSSSCEVGESR